MKYRDEEDLLEACRAIIALADGQGRQNLPEVAGMARQALKGWLALRPSAEGGRMTDHELVNMEGTVIIASSRKGAEEVYRTLDGRYWHISHLKSGRDVVEATLDSSPSHLTVRYNPPLPAPQVREWADG